MTIPSGSFYEGEGADILREFPENRHLDPGCQKNLALVRKWQDYITVNFYTCPKVILSCLGDMYIGDGSFTQNIDRYGRSTALFMATSIEIFCKK